MSDNLVCPYNSEEHRIRALNGAFSTVLKRLGYARMVESIDETCAAYDQWSCERTPCFFERFGLRDHDARFLHDVFTEGEDRILRLALKDATRRPTVRDLAQRYAGFPPFPYKEQRRAI
ncbi:hypothetical protein GF342_05695 [Candidatus Woesearchaeota archaeon]|nr:hypothetical protein [Candidatus Woesearchaeota archaeon]